MSAPRSSEPSAHPLIATDAVCTACGCLCDDIELHVQADRIEEARNACELGRASFLREESDDGPACLIDGRPVRFEEGIERAARILSDARYPLILGLSETTSEAQRAAVSLADRVGACIDVAGAVEATIALQEVGEVTCTLGEIKNRADLVVVWGADPLETHPRLFSRYALDPTGAFLPGGRSDRYCVIVDVGETKSVRESADQFIAIEEGGQFVALWIMRALVKGIELDSDEVEQSTGAPLTTWQALMDRMRAARYGVLFYGTGTASGGSRAAHAAHALTRELNGSTRFVCMPLPRGRNLNGALNVLTWRTGFPFAVSLAAGYPRYGPGEFTADSLLGRGETDAVLIVSGDAWSALSTEARESLTRIPSVALTSASDIAGFQPTVVFRTVAFGINSAGTVYRVDGVPLPLRPALASPFSRDEDVLRAIERRVGSDDACGPVISGEAERCP